mmetsp:Transcript_27328/g.63630  ORF Transcript_27328/g.63630 Transcript_27328/m.63630 type:complete len:263 (+) Transcript_27328:559-1347(+)
MSSSGYSVSKYCVSSLFPDREAQCRTPLPELSRSAILAACDKQNFASSSVPVRAARSSRVAPSHSGFRQSILAPAFKAFLIEGKFASALFNFARSAWLGIGPSSSSILFNSALMYISLPWTAVQSFLDAISICFSRGSSEAVGDESTAVEARDVFDNVFASPGRLRVEETCHVGGSSSKAAGDFSMVLDPRVGTERVRANVAWLKSVKLPAVLESDDRERAFFMPRQPLLRAKASKPPVSATAAKNSGDSFRKIVFCPKSGR